MANKRGPYLQYLSDPASKVPKRTLTRWRSKKKGLADTIEQGDRDSSTAAEAVEKGSCFQSSEPSLSLGPDQNKHVHDQHPCNDTDIEDLPISEGASDVFGNTELRSQQAESSFEEETEDLLHYTVTDAEHQKWQNNSNEGTRYKSSI